MSGSAPKHENNRSHASLCHCSGPVTHTFKCLQVPPVLLKGFIMQMHRNVAEQVLVFSDMTIRGTYIQRYIQLTYENELHLKRKWPIKHEVVELLNPSMPYFGPFRSLA